jgi:hypothetical protein
MDDWSPTPSRNAVSEPAPNHQSPMSDPRTTDCQAQPAASSAPTGADQPCPPNQALDSTGLARRHSNDIQGEAPKPLYPPDNQTITTANQRTTSKTANRPLDITRPFMDDNSPSIWAKAHSPVVHDAASPDGLTYGAGAVASRFPELPMRLGSRTGVAAGLVKRRRVKTARSPVRNCGSPRGLSSR